MRLAIITDTHYGARKGSKHLHDYFELFYKNVFFPSLEAEGIDTIIHMGDVFDGRKSIDYYSLEWAKRVVFEPMKKYKVYAITGNHDCYYKNTNEINSPELLLTSYDNWEIYSSAVDINIDGLDILLLPWISADNHDETIEVIKKSKSKIAMGHLELNGFKATRGHLMEDGMDVSLFDKFEQVYSGHFHTRSTNGKISYLGNPYEMFWNDVNDKRGFHIYDTETLKLKTVNNPFQLYKVINYSDTPRQLTNFTEYTDKIVKVVVRQKSNEKEYNRFMQSLDKARPVDVKVVERTDHLVYDGEIVEQTEDTMTLLTKYVDDLETDLDRVRIKKVISEVYTEALECTL